MMMRIRVFIAISLLLCPLIEAASTTNEPPCGNPPPPDPCEGLSGAALECCLANNPAPNSGGGSGSGGGGCGCNPFNPFSGSVSRKITDLRLAHTVGKHRLSFDRIFASRYRPYPYDGLEGTSPLGDGGNWRHSYHWNVMDAGTNDAGRPIIRILYPDGRYGNFDKDKDTSTFMTFLATTHERVLPDGTNYWLIMTDGTRHHFTSWEEGTDTLFRMEGFSDPWSNKYDYVYGADGALNQVVGPNTNQFLTYSWTNVPLAESVSPGNIEFTFDYNDTTNALLAGDFNGWQGEAMSQSGSVWSLTKNLTNGMYQYKFVTVDAGITNWHTDPENPLWVHNYSNSLAVLEPYRLISSVEGSDGRSVSYQYGSMRGFDCYHFTLTNVVYGDGTEAVYTYYPAADNSSRRPEMESAIDPMYHPGPGREIKYEYQPEWVNATDSTHRVQYVGQIHKEISLVTTQTMARLELDGDYPTRRQVYEYGELSTFHFSNETGAFLSSTNPLGHTTHNYRHYSGHGMLATNVDTMGRVTVYERTEEFGMATSISNNIRGARTFHYTDETYPFYIATNVDVLGRATIYTRDDKHRPTRIDFPDDTYTTFDYNASGQVLTNRLKDGGLWTYQYDSKGRRTSATGPDNVPTYYAYNSRDQLASETNALEHVTRYYYDWRGSRTNIVYPDDTQESIAYNSWGQITSRTDRAGNVVITTYDQYGYRAGVSNMSGSATTYSADSEGHVMTMTSPSGLTVSNTYDAIGRRTRETYLSDNTYREWHYDPDGVRTQRNRLGVCVYSTYTPAGLLASVEDAYGRTTSYVYDLAGRRTAMTNAIDDVTEWLYDDADRMISVSGCSGTTSNVYDSLGRMLMTVAPGPITNSYVYDSVGRRLSSHVNGYQISSNRYDAIGRTIWSMAANGLVRTNTLDVMGRVLKSYMPDGTYYENIYSNTFLVQSLDRAGRKTTYQHDSFGRVTNQVDNATNSVSYGYDVAGRMTILIDQSGNETTSTYDSEGRMTGKTYADQTQTLYDYNAEGQLTARTDANLAITDYEYDVIGTLTAIVYQADTDITFSYDELGRKTSMTDAIGTTTYSYEGSCPNVISENGPYVGDTITYGYDEAKRLTNIAFFGKDVSYEYDALGRLVTAIGSEGTNAYTYVANGRMVSQLDRANGTDALYQHDDLMRLTNLVNRLSGQSVLSSFAYTYNDADQRTAVAREDAHHIDYGYDPIGQLLSAQGQNADSSPRPGQDFEFAYDATGNPLLQNRNGFLLTNTFNELNQNVTSLWGGAMSVIGAINTQEADVTVNGSDAVVLDDMTFVAANLAISAGTNLFTAVVTDPFDRKATNTSEVIVANHGYQYDLEGNLTNDGRFAYTWNDENRLVEVKDAASGSPVMECAYDGQGRRRERVTYADGLATTNKYVYHNWAVLAVLDGDDTMLETYTHGIDLSGSMGGAGGIGGILAMTQVSDLSPQPFFYHYDAQGNVTQVSDLSPQPSIVATYTYSPFGIVLSKTGTYNSRYQFSTKEYDSAVGLNYYGYRYYNPQLGRWPSRDPIGQLGGMNLYAFVNNCPVCVIDPYGLVACSWAVGRCSRNVAGANVPNTITVGSVTINIPQWLQNAVNAVVPDHHDVRVESYASSDCTGTPEESVTRGFFADDFNASIVAYLRYLYSTYITAIPGETGNVAGSVKDSASTAGPCSMTCGSKDRFDTVKTRITTSTTTSYNLGGYNCQNWANDMLAP